MTLPPHGRPGSATAFGGDGDRPGIGFDRAALGVGKFCPARNDPHLGTRQEPGDAVAEPVDDAVLPRDGAREVETRWAGNRKPKRVVAGSGNDAGEFVGGVDQRLRRDAAAQHAGAAGPLGIDQHGVEA
jgi:hypothetical protein